MGLVNPVIGEIFTADIVDQKAAGASSGAGLTAAWQTRVLNTVRSNTIAGLTVVANQISLPRGTFEISARSPCYSTGRTKARLWDVTNDVLLLQGGSAFVAASIASDSFVNGVFTLGVTTLIELQHYTEIIGDAARGLGVETNNGTPEIFATVLLRQIS